MNIDNTPTMPFMVEVSLHEKIPDSTLKKFTRRSIVDRGGEPGVGRWVHYEFKQKKAALAFAKRIQHTLSGKVTDARVFKLRIKIFEEYDLVTR